MEKHRQSYGMVVIFNCFLAYALFQLVYNFSLKSALLAVIFLFPLMAGLFYVIQPIWLGVAVGLLEFSFTIEYSIFKQIEIPMIVGGCIFVYTMALTAIQDNDHTISYNFAAKLILLSGAIILLRVIYDRPGSANIGGMGGAGQAGIYVLAALSFWTFSILTAKEENHFLNFKWIIAIAVVSCVYETATYPFSFSQALFLRSAWLLYAFILAYVFYRNEKNETFDNKWVYLASLAIFLFAILSHHRSRPIFALGIIAAIAYCYGHFRRLSIFIVVISIIGIGGVFFIKPTALPASTLRSLSIVLPVSQEAIMEFAKEERVSSELGWESDFRSTLYKLAWNEIKKQPVFGRGFVFSKEYLNSIYRTADTYVSTLTASLALTGSHHNSLLTLAVNCGIPATLFYIFGAFLLIKRFLQNVKNIDSPEERLIASAIAGFSFPAVGQMLVNGSGRDFFIVTLLLGVMYGILYKNKFIQP